MSLIARLLSFRIDRSLIRLYYLLRDRGGRGFNRQIVCPVGIEGQDAPFSVLEAPE